MAEILLALEYLHSRDIIYRDVVMDSEGHAMLTDFGLSKIEVHDDTVTKTYCGSPGYLAPEMVLKAGHGKSVDWYLFGVLLYELLVGIPPYYTNDVKQLNNNILTANLSIPSFVSDAARSLITSLLERNQYKRLGTGQNGA